MTPGERDKVRAMAVRPCAPNCTAHGACIVGRAILRYVPPGVVPPSLLSATAERRADGRWVIDFDHGMCTPESARRIAAEFNAAADAAEED